MLLVGNDGEYTRNITVQAFQFADLVPVLPVGLFQGMGTIITFNPLLTPSLIPLPFFADAVGKWLAFMICAALLFVSTYALGRSLEIRRGVALLAAWALPPLCLPYQSWLNLYLTFNLNPLAGDTVSFIALLLALVAIAYTSARPGWVALGVLLIVIWLFLANPLWVLVVTPAALFVTLGIIVSHWWRAGFVKQTALLGFPAIIFPSIGWRSVPSRALHGHGGLFFLARDESVAHAFLADVLGRDGVEPRN